MNFFQLAVIVQSVESVINFLRDRNILCRTVMCCGQECSIIKDQCSDGQIFQCPRCRKKNPFSKAPFFSRSQLPLKVLLTIVYFFTQSTSASEAFSHLKQDCCWVSIIQWYAFCHDICSQYLLNNTDIVLGSEPGSVVQIDECFLGGKLKHNRGDPT